MNMSFTIVFLVLFYFTKKNKIKTKTLKKFVFISKMAENQELYPNDLQSMKKKETGGRFDFDVPVDFLLLYFYIMT